MLKIDNLSVEVNDKKILNNFSLNINNKQIHAIMGPNGIGKSTICKTIMGDSNYIVTSGIIKYEEKDLLKMDVCQRAKAGIFLLNQMPIAIPGVTNAELLRSALNEKNGTVVSIFDFNKKMESICERLNLPKSFIHRDINEGMSGGERKKNELLHLWILEPKLILLDELDSGLDIDSLKLVGNNLKEYFDTHDCSILLITHHLDLLKLLNVDYIHVMGDGKIIETGDYNLALDVDKNGYNKAKEVSE